MQVTNSLLNLLSFRSLNPQFQNSLSIFPQSPQLLRLGFRVLLVRGLSLTPINSSRGFFCIFFFLIPLSRRSRTCKRMPVVHGNSVTILNGLLCACQVHFLCPHPNTHASSCPKHKTGWLFLYCFAPDRLVTATGQGVLESAVWAVPPSAQ